jgi:Glyoxalase/Bleomycin resistance protein/Dioxygenase superfamily
MRVTALDHVQLAMPPGGEPQARDFYYRVLGIPEIPKPPVLATRGGCWFECGAVKIHLGAEADFRPARKAHPALIVEDLAGLRQTLQTAGYSVRPGEFVNGWNRIFVDDPFGNRLELMERQSGYNPEVQHGNR